MHRKVRVGELVLTFLAQELGRLRDPRIEGVTLTGVDMSEDLKTAHVYWTSHGLGGASLENTAVELTAAAALSGDGCRAPEAQIADTAVALTGVTGLLRRRMSAELRLRFTPTLHFHYDRSLDTAARIEALLRAAREQQNPESGSGGERSHGEEQDDVS